MSFLSRFHNANVLKNFFLSFLNVSGKIIGRWIKKHTHKKKWFIYKDHQFLLSVNVIDVVHKYDSHQLPISLFPNHQNQRKIKESEEKRKVWRMKENKERKNKSSDEKSRSGGKTWWLIFFLVVLLVVFIVIYGLPKYLKSTIYI